MRKLLPGPGAGFFIRVILVLAIFFSFRANAFAVRDSIPGFPDNWAGKWRGKLEWYRGDSAHPRHIPMQLDVLPADSGNWLWHLSYGPPGADSRPYRLLVKDKAKGHWIIDENDGILLDQYVLANKLIGIFSVQGTTILNSYERIGDQLIVEMYVMSASVLQRSGKGTEDVPHVDSYRVKSYQRAILHRRD